MGSGDLKLGVVNRHLGGRIVMMTHCVLMLVDCFSMEGGPIFVLI